MFSQKLFTLEIVITIVYILKFARFTLFYGLTTYVISLTYLSSKPTIGGFFEISILQWRGGGFKR